MPGPDYVFHGVEDQRELERLRMIEREFDPGSRRRLLTAGLQVGWNCLEVGPGAGSILNWMRDVVGPSGRVCAVDPSIKFLSRAQPEQVQIIQDDIRRVCLPVASFDLVHARYVLIHVPDYDKVLSKMLDCLKPGG
jgi:ubiquinone/menaquinone biosynthesis C-methylase UbiE